MKKVQVRSGGPFLIAAAVYALYALIFPMYRTFHFILALAVALGIFFLCDVLWPKKTKLVVEKPGATGNSDADKLLRDGYRDLARIHEELGKIKNPAFAGPVRLLVERGSAILRHVTEFPQKADSVRRFCSYYLPTTAKLLRAYADLEAQTYEAGHIEETKADIEKTILDMPAAFDRQLDCLYRDVALDISTDIVVLEQLLERDGLQDRQGAPGASETKE